MMFRRQIQKRLIDHCLSRNLSLSHCELARKVLPTSHKVHKLASKSFQDLINEELERRKKLDSKRRENKKYFSILMDDPYHLQNFLTTLLSTISKAFLMPNVRDDLVGRGINITKAKFAPKSDCLLVYWITTKKNCEEETAKILEIRSDDILHNINEVSQIGDLPPLKFVKDMEYMTSIALEKEFSMIEAEKAIQLPSTQMTENLMDRLCHIKKGSNVFDFDRSNALEQVKQKIQSSKSVHRVNPKRGPDDPPLIFEGFFEKQPLSRTYVKKYLGSRRKQFTQASNKLRENVQGEEDF